MKCPHCTVEIHTAFVAVPFTTDCTGDWCIKHCICPALELKRTRIADKSRDRPYGPNRRATH